MTKDTIKTFLKSQASSFIATGVEYGTLTSWVEFLHFYYPFGVALGAMTGAITNFTISRYWAFKAGSAPVGPQILKYVVVSAGSMALNTGGVYLVTEYLHIYYLFSTMAVGLIVGFVYNYPLQKYWVYKVSDQQTEAVTA